MGTRSSEPALDYKAFDLLAETWKGKKNDLEHKKWPDSRLHQGRFILHALGLTEGAQKLLHS